MCYYKIGVTARQVEERLPEIKAELAGYVGEAKITVLGCWQHCGRVEHYFKYRFRAHNQRIGPLSEYFSFDADQAKKVLRELRRLKSKQTLSEEEQQIASQKSSCLEAEVEALKAAYTKEMQVIKRKRTRSRSIHKGMQAAASQGQHIGRPSGREAVDAFLAKPKNQAIAQALGEDLSLREASRRTGSAINTVRKVKAMLSESVEP